MSSVSIPMDEQIRIAEKDLDRVLEWVTRIDNKSFIVLGIDTGLLGALSASAPALSRWTLPIQVFTGLSLGVLFISFVLVSSSIYPRTKGTKSSLIFFQSVSQMKFEDFKRLAGTRTDQGYLDDLIGQCHRNSEIMTAKFRDVAWAYRFLLGSLPFWAVTLYLFKSLPPVGA